MATFTSIYDIGDYVEFNYVELLEKPTHKKLKTGWILDVNFACNGKISYTIYGGITKRGSLWVYGGILDKDIINKDKESNAEKN